MERWGGRVALVTGSSRGIGAGIAAELARRGMKVFACARNIHKIQEMQQQLKTEHTAGEVIPVQCDLRKEDEILRMFDLIKQKHGGVDLCVNNAGVCHRSTLTEGTTEQWREMLEVNILALCICTREAVKSMRERNVNDGQIIHISSMSGHRLTVKEEHFYACTKQAVKALTEGLRCELRQAGTKIRVASISPANVYTEMTSNESDTYRFLDVSDITDALLYILSAKPHAQIHDVLIRSVEQEK